MLRPGCPARALWKAVREFMDGHPLSRGTFWHHIGHGVGFGGHEAPRLVPESDHVLRLYDIVSIEPGFYNPSLQGGLRIENTYWITAHGPVQLNQHSTSL
jgi:Xaa-Pro aminopeptidase